MIKINSQIQALYNYEVDQTKDQITIILRIPEQFDVNFITINIENSESQKSSLIVSIPNEPPLISGSLFAAISPKYKACLETKQLNGKNIALYNISLQKKEKSTWPVLINSKHPITNEIDPMSSYYLYNLYYKSSKEEEKKLAQQEIIHASECGLPIAARVYAKILYNNNEKEKSINLLKTSVNEYDDYDAMCQLGRYLYYWKKETQEEGLHFLRRASQLGKTEVNGLLGQILSPFSEYEYDKKNAKEAVYYLRLALENQEDEEEEEISSNDMTLNRNEGDSAKIEVDVEIEEEEEEKENEEESQKGNESEDGGERQKILDELKKIIDSGVVDQKDKNKNTTALIAVGSTLLAVAIGLAFHFKRKK